MSDKAIGLQGLAQFLANADSRHLKKSEANQANGAVLLDSNVKIPTEFLPDGSGAEFAAKEDIEQIFVNLS